MYEFTDIKGLLGYVKKYGYISYDKDMTDKQDAVIKVTYLREFLLKDGNRYVISQKGEEFLNLTHPFHKKRISLNKLYIKIRSNKNLSVPFMYIVSIISGIITAYFVHKLGWN